MKRLLTAAAVLMVATLSTQGCTAIFEFSASTAGGSTSGVGGSEASSDGSTKSKLSEFYIEVDAGADGELKPEDVTTTQYWGDELADTNQTKTGDKTAVNYNQSVVLEPTRAPEKTGNKYRFYYLATIQFGWNKFSTTAKIVRTATNAKGDKQVKEEEVPIEDTYVFGDFGGIIPLKVTLNWGKPEADVDLIVLEANQKAVFWGELGYDKNCCVSKGCVATRPECYQKDQGGDGYIVGEDRKKGVTYGSLDKDDRGNGGPEIYTLDPQEANIDGAKVVVADYKDGDEFIVAVNYFKDFKPGVKVRPRIGIYINGSKTPRCFVTTQKVTAHELKEDPMKEMETLIKFGTFKYSTSFAHTFDMGEGGTAGAGSDATTAIEEFPPTGEDCKMPEK